MRRKREAKARRRREVRIREERIMEPREECVARKRAAWMVCVDVGGGGGRSGLHALRSQLRESS